MSSKDAWTGFCVIFLVVLVLGILACLVFIDTPDITLQNGYEVYVPEGYILDPMKPYEIVEVNEDTIVAQIYFVYKARE